MVQLRLFLTDPQLQDSHWNLDLPELRRLSMSNPGFAFVCFLVPRTMICYIYAGVGFKAASTSSLHKYEDVLQSYLGKQRPRNHVPPVDKFAQSLLQCPKIETATVIW